MHETEVAIVDRDEILKYQIEDLKLCLKLRSGIKMFRELGQLQKYLVCGKCDNKLILPQEFNALEPLISKVVTTTKKVVLIITITFFQKNFIT